MHLLGGLVFLALAVISDRLTLRSPFLVLANCIGIVGYALILAPTSHAVKFFGTFLCAVAVYNGPGINLIWLNVNVAPHYRRAAAIGFQQTLGNCAGIVAGQIYRSSPYTLGNAFSMGAVVLSQMLIGGKFLYIRRQTSTKARIARGDITDTRKVTTGDRELDFKYHL